MALKDKNVLTASTGFIYVGSPGLADPGPAGIEAFDPLTFGAKQYDVEVTASTGNVKFSVEGTDTADIPFDSDAATIQTAIEAVAGIGSGNVEVTAGTGAKKFVVTFTGALQGVDVDLDTSGAGSTVAVKTALNGWTMVGHTSREEMPEFGQDGGDTEVRGTWQNVALREVQTEAQADYLTINVNQVDRQTFTLYYGAESGPSVPGVFDVSGNAGPSERAILIVIVDGDLKLGFTARKASVRRADAISLATDDFMALPIRATFTKHGAHPLYRWISKDLFE